jgi:ECF sigma factor
LVRWQNRADFLAIAARLMRRVLVDFARSRNYSKRGGKSHRVSLKEAVLIPDRPDQNFVVIDEALTALAELDPRKSQIAELRFSVYSASKKRLRYSRYRLEQSCGIGI